MSKNLFSLFLMCAVVLIACSSTQSSPEPVPTVPPSVPEPAPIDEVDENGFLRGEAYVNESQLFIMESFPIQVAVEIKGDLPSPCHTLVANVAEPDEDKRIFIEIYAGYKLGEDCIQVLEPFEERISISMSDQSDGLYSIWLNGEKMGEFSYPA